METEKSALARLLDELRRIKAMSAMRPRNERVDLPSVLAKLDGEARQDFASRL